MPGVVSISNTSCAVVQNHRGAAQRDKKSGVKTEIRSELRAKRQYGRARSLQALRFFVCSSTSVVSALMPKAGGPQRRVVVAKVAGPSSSRTQRVDRAKTLPLP